MIRFRVNRQNDDSLRCWLVGHPAKDDRTCTMATNLRNAVVRNQQADSGASWAEKQFSDKGNQHVEVSATGTRNFGSAIEAWRWKNLLKGVEILQPHPWAGDVVERHELEGGGFEEVKYPNAVIALEPILGHGASMALGYTIKAGHCEPLRVGQRCSMTVPVMANATLKIYGTNAGGTFTNGDEGVGMAWALGTDELQTGDRFTVYWKPDSLSQTLREFRINTATGGGWTVINDPLTSNLAALATALDAEPDLTAAVVTPATGRPYVLVSFVGTVGVDGPGGTVVGLYANDGPTGLGLVYSAQNTGAGVPTTLVIGTSTLMVDEATA
jgi:hypothetical protein